MRFPAFLSALLLGTAACQRTAGAGPVFVRDAQGHRVSLAAPAQRVVSLSPATTELLFALGAGARVVGRTRWCDYPPAALAVPSVGDGLNPNIEAVAGRHPDLVAMYGTSANEPAVAQLAGLGIAAVNLPMDRLADVSRSARLLGVLLGDSARGDSLAAGFDAALDSLRAAVPAAGPSVVMIAWDNPPIVIGGGSFLSELVELAGGHNAFADIPQPSATVNIESIAARRPDLLLVLGDSGLPAWASRPEWRAVPAVRAGRFVHLRGSQFERPSFRAIGAARELAAAFGRGAAP